MVTNDPVSIAEQEGTGFAKVFTPQKAESIITPEFIERRFEKIKEEKARQAKFKANMSEIQSLTNLMPQFKEEIEKRQQKIVDMATYSQVELGIDPEDYTSPVFKSFNQELTSLKNDIAQEKLAATRLNEIVSDVAKNGTKYDQDVFNEWLGKVKATKNVNEFSNLILNEDPRVENIDLFEDADKFVPELSEYGTLSDEDAKLSAKKYLDYRLVKDNGIIEKVGKKSSAPFKDLDTAVDYYADFFKSKAGFKPRPKESGGGGLTINTGNALSSGDYVATFGYNENTPHDYVDEINQIGFVNSKTGKPLPPINFSVGGKNVYAQVSGGTKERDGKWYLRGKQAKVLSAGEFAELPKEEQNGYSMNFNDAGEQEYVSVKEGKEILIPIGTEGEAANNNNLLTAAYGRDVLAEANKRDTSKSKGKTGSYYYNRNIELRQENKNLHVEIADERKKANPDTKLIEEKLAKIDKNSKEIEANSKTESYQKIKGGSGSSQSTPSSGTKGRTPRSNG